MLQVKPINSFESAGISTRSILNGPNFDRQLAMTRADALLKTTRQYARWQVLQQSDPTKAEQVAQIVLQRHAYIAGKAPRNATGRMHFDQLTHQLRSTGIFLFKSHQFKQPIFNLSKTEHVSDNSTLNRSSQITASVKNTMLQNLRNRYKNSDCLEFLANLLEDNGIAYYGKNGLAHQLIGQARNQGKNLNAYLTGEGLTRELSSQPTTIRLNKDYDGNFEKLWDHIKPHVQAGSILSFSSKNFGHTGLVDRIDNRWVYFNASGSVGKPETYRVKAEDLKPEVKSWFDRAQKQETFLNITIGAIDPSLAAQFQNLPAGDRHISDQPIDLLASHRLVPRSSAT
jgi:hypothetical protein